MLLRLENSALLRMPTYSLPQLRAKMTMKYFLKKQNNQMNYTLFLTRPKNGGAYCAYKYCLFMYFNCLFAFPKFVLMALLVLTFF